MSTFTWSNQYGGSWTATANWTDITAGLPGIPATVAPGAADTVLIAGSTASSTFTVVTDAGAAAQLGINNNVLFWGTAVTVGGKLSLLPLTTTTGTPSTTPTLATLDLDNAATVTAGSLLIGAGCSLQAGGASTLKVASGATMVNGSLVAIDGSTVQLGGLVANAVTSTSYFGHYGNSIGVDANSSIEIGTAGGAALGAITIDKGKSAAVSGGVYGSVVVSGTLAVQGGQSLTIGTSTSPAASTSITGGGLLVLSEGSTLSLGVADGAAISFNGPAGRLSLAVLPTGTISGFTTGDVIDVGSLATGVTYAQTSASVATLTLTNGGKAAGTLTLAGNYAGDIFHLSGVSTGDALITLQTIGTPPVQPSLIVGTVGSDTLFATANNQTLTGLGGSDTFSGGGFTGVNFKDTSANLNGSTINGFVTSDVIDLTDMSPTASVTYQPAYYANYSWMPGNLTVKDATHSTTILLPAPSSGTTLPIGYFAAATDGATGAILQYIAVNTDTYSFLSPVGGSWAVAANWQDTTTGTAATVAPSYGNAVAIGGGGSGFINVSGTGAAASLTTNGAVRLWAGPFAIGSMVSGVSGALNESGALQLDGGASLTLTGTATVNGQIAVGGASTLSGAGALSFAQAGSSLLAFGGSSATFASCPGYEPPGYTNYYTYFASTIGVDSTSSIEFGKTGAATKGALTIDAGVTAALAGAIDGNVVVNGTLSVLGNLAIAPFGAAAPTVKGTGTVVINSNYTLTLAGSDTTAIAFANTSIYNGGTLALTGSLPTGRISGFAVGDTIMVAKTVTGLSYTQTTAAVGTLTLLNGTTKVGTLSLAGTYAASQFQTRLGGVGQFSTITYSPAPSPVTGIQVASDSNAYSWSNTSGGDWSNPTNWTVNGATATGAPVGGNAVSFNLYTPDSSPRIITGSGAAASLSIYSNAPTVFTGNLAIAGVFSPGTSALASGAVVTAGSLDAYGGVLQVGGASTLTVTGPSLAYLGGTLDVIGASQVQLDSGASIYGTVVVDSTSSLELGAAGGAAAGALTIDAGQQPYFSNGTIAARVVLTGTLSATNGLIEGFGGTVGSITGSGTILLNGGTLVLNASDSAAISFAAYAYDLLELRGPLPTGAITGFGSFDAIRIDQTVTGASFVQSTASGGILTLSNGTATVGTLALTGTYAGALFHVDVAASTGVSTITLQTVAAAGTDLANTSKDAFSWASTTNGSWTTATNWKDTTTGTTPTTVPGSGNAVTIAGNPYLQNNAAVQYTTVAGNGAAASLTTNGNVLLNGTIAVTGLLSVAPSASGPSELALDAHAKLTAGSTSIKGTLSASAASSATMTGLGTLSGGTLLALGGSTIRLGGLIGNNSNNVIAVDATSIVKIGSPVTAAAGALTVQTGVTAVFTGSIFGSVAANGTLSVAGGGSLFIDMANGASSHPYSAAPTITGTAGLLLAEGSTLGIGVADSGPISFAGPNASLVLAAIPTGTINGFAAGDRIQVNKTVTGLAYAQGATSATLTLTNGATTVGTLTLAGIFGSSSSFHLATAADGSSATITLESIGVAAAQPALIQGTAGSDQLAATGFNQTLTGLGGGDSLVGGAFTGVVFNDSTTNLNGSVISGFDVSDKIDFTNLTSTAPTITFAAGKLSVSDGTHSASVALTFGTTPASGHFASASDGATGTILSWAA